MNTNGIFQIDFNVDMMTPTKINQKMYGQIFEFNVVSIKDGSKAEGVFGSTNKSRKLENV